MYNCKIVADSSNTFGNRITTFELTYPRIVHAELMTHRLFSRNAASSRAIPVLKMIESIRNNMFTPLAIQKSHKGMQGSDYFEGVELEQAKQLWIESAELAIQQAEKMRKFGISKQIVNRVVEPYQYYQVLVTATEWENFFELRCPKYHTPVSGEGFYFRSKKDCIANHSSPENLSKLENMTDLEWLQINYSQAEIHIQKIAEMMWDAINESTPKKLQAGEWHIPFGDNFDEDKVAELYYEVINNDRPDSHISSIEETKSKIAVARAARISYTTLGDNPKIDYEADIKLHDRLLKSKHLSCFEHCARVMTKQEYMGFYLSQGNNDPFDEKGKDTFGVCNNYRGFIQYRYLIENQ